MTAIEKFERLFELPKLNTTSLAEIHELLGKKPDNCLRVIRDSHRPVVLLSDPLSKGLPFPTLFWLAGTIEKKLVSEVEAVGTIKELEADPEVQELVKKDHELYRDLRIKLYEMNHSPLTKEDKFYKSIYETGIGGVQDFTRIRCLHMHTAFHLVMNTNLGKYLNEREILKITPIL